MTVEIFEVGGAVRDSLLGLESHDIDYTVVAGSFEEMEDFIVSQGLTIVVSKPEFGTIRAITANGKTFRGDGGGIDFVWAREDGPYTDGRRPDWTKPADLKHDLARRDFTVNAMAIAANGMIIDPFGGQEDLAVMRLRAVGNPTDRIKEDPLRMLRALRFVVTKGFRMHRALFNAIDSNGDLITTVSQERIREELLRMFQADTLKTLSLLNEFPRLRDTIFAGGIWLMPTLRK